MRTTIGQSIDFSAAGNSAAAQLYGWSVQEAAHVWTIGAESALCVAAPQAPLGYYLEITWRPFVFQPFLDAQPVTIHVNGVRVFSGDVREPEVVAVPCPAPRIGDRRMVVTVAHPNAMRPALFDKSDERELALCFSRVRVLPIVAQVPAFERRKSITHLDGATTTELAAAAQSISGLDVGEIMGRFEMICGNCDMGLAQRAFGLEPLSLLRFAGTYPAVSIPGLDTNFANLGEGMEPWVGKKEWMIRDSVGINYHTGQLVADVAEERLLQMERVRIGFLRRKLLEDLAEGEKIFVADRISSSLRGVLPLFLALNRQGPPRRLLWIVAARDRPHGGTVEEVIPGLFMGRIYPFGGPAIDHVSVRGWLEMLVSACVLMDGKHQADHDRSSEVKASATGDAAS